MFLEVKASSTSVERSLGSTASGGNKLRHIIFVIIESGMTLLVIQLVRVVLWVVETGHGHCGQLTPGPVVIALEYLDVINEMFNVIIRSVQFYFFCFTEKNYLASRASHQQ